MLKAIINGQHAMKRELLDKIDNVEKRLTGRIDGMEGKIESVGINLSNRIDKIGKQLAFLEDDTPTREEFDNLGGRVVKLEHKSTKSL